MYNLFFLYQGLKLNDQKSCRVIFSPFNQFNDNILLIDSHKKTYYSKFAITL